MIENVITKKILMSVIIISLSLMLRGESWAQSNTELSAADNERIENQLAVMTIEEKAGQLFMVSLFGRDLTETGAALINDYHPGAVALFNYNTDFEPASQVAKLINDMQGYATSTGAEIPLIIAADQEGGDVRRIVNDVTVFPDPLGLGAITEYDSIERVAEITGAHFHQAVPRKARHFEQHQ